MEEVACLCWSQIKRRRKTSWDATYYELWQKLKLSQGCTKGSANMSHVCLRNHKCDTSKLAGKARASHLFLNSTLLILFEVLWPSHRSISDLRFRVLESDSWVLNPPSYCSKDWSRCFQASNEIHWLPSLKFHKFCFEHTVQSDSLRSHCYPVQIRLIASGKPNAEEMYRLQKNQGLHSFFRHWPELSLVSQISWPLALDMFINLFMHLASWTWHQCETSISAMVQLEGTKTLGSGGTKWHKAANAARAWSFTHSIAA